MFYVAVRWLLKKVKVFFCNSNYNNKFAGFALQRPAGAMKNVPQFLGVSHVFIMKGKTC